MAAWYILGVARSFTLKAILFDIDDTLYSTTEFAEQARRNSIEAMIRMGLRVEPEAAFRELKEVISGNDCPRCKQPLTIKRLKCPECKAYLMPTEGLVACILLLFMPLFLIGLSRKYLRI